MLAALEDTARHGYGKNWEDSAAIKGLVAATAAGAAVAAGAVGVAAAGAGAAGATTTAAAGTATVGATTTVGTATTAGAGISGTTVAAGAGAVAVVGAAAVAFVVISNALFGHNLVVNGNAEQGSGAHDASAVVAPNNWTTKGPFTVLAYGSPQFPSQSDMGPPDRGTYFFAGGPNNAQSSASQTIDLSGGSGGIDGGSKRYTLSAWLGGFSNQNDNATVEVIFQDASGRPLGTGQIGPVTELTRAGKSGLVKTTTTGDVPKGARKAIVRILMQRTDGAYNDGYADDVSLVIN
jgi:hypothetical protein